MGDLIYAYGELHEGKLHPGSLEILTPLRQVADQLNKKLALLVLSASLDEVRKCEDLKKANCDEVHVVSHKGLEHFKDDLFGRVVSQVIRQEEPFGVFFPATHQGMALAPRVAGELGAGLCAHVNGFAVEEEKLVMLRPTYGDNIIAKLYSKTLPVMATISLGAFTITAGKREPLIKTLSLPENFNWESKIQIRKFRPSERALDRLSIARVVVAGGLGLKTKENFQKLFQLARFLEGEVGATRPVCHAGWIEDTRMVGVSGVSVRPRLYIGFGISGAIQHTAGMENSEFIIAVNTDREAPLVKLAHISLIADAGEVLDQLLKKLEQVYQQVT